MLRRGTSLRVLFLRLAALVSLWRQPVALIIDDLSTFDDTNYVLTFELGLAPNATVSLDLSNAHPKNNTYVMIITHSQLVAWQQDQVVMPAISGNQQVPSSYFGTFWRADFRDHVKAELTIDSNWSDRYTMIVMNPLQQPIELSGSVSIVNPGGEQLALEEVQVPKVLIWMAGLFTASSVLFILLLTTVWRQGRTKIHLLIGLVLLFKSVVLFLHWCDVMLMSHSGQDSLVGRVGWQLLDKVQTILELMMFLLISLGWKYLRASLNATEVRFAIGISIISFYLGVFEVACKTNSTCSGYKLSRYILHSLCYLVVIVAMNFNLQMVQAQIAEAPASQEAGKLYQKHRAYRHFRWIFLAFIIAPTVELFVKVSMMPWDALWAFYLVQCLRTWTIYALMIAAFRPDPPPLRVFELTVRGGSDEDSEVEAGE